MREVAVCAGLVLLAMGASACDESVGPTDGGAPSPDGATSADAGDVDAAGLDGAVGLDAAIPIDDPVVLPIEVLGPDGYTVSVTVPVEDGAGIDGLYLQGHRLGYRDGRGDKASVRINGGDWIALNNDSARVMEPEASYEGIGGAYATVRCVVPITGVVTGDNVIDFRFEGTDGHTMGYRVLDLDLRRGDEPVLPSGVFVRDDPNAWTPPSTDAADVEAGRALFSERELVESPLSDARLRARCADCHARDGRDLAYFNYSTWSIVARSMFHGLTEEEGRQVASWVRSIDLGLPDGVTQRDLGRPWNPPYQPGPGLDARPVIQWSAGAGLEQVLDDDGDMEPYVAPGGAGPLDIDGTVNVREIPMALQLPDWNAWLPDVHPLDALGDAFATSPMMQRYEDAHRDFTSGRPLTELVFAGDLEPITRILLEFQRQLGALKAAQADGSMSLADSEDGRRAISHWVSVKQWEIIQAYRLEDVGPALRGDGASPRMWPTPRARNVFDVAPHFSSGNGSHYRFQSQLSGKYASTAWYQLQILLNAGDRLGDVINPVDWNYHPAHIKDLRAYGGPAHPWRTLLSYQVMLQSFNDGRGLIESSFGFVQIHPGYYAPGGSYGIVFAGLSDADRARVYELLLQTYLALVERFAPSEWPRGAGALPEPASHVPSASASLDTLTATGEMADALWVAIPRFRDAGVSAATIDRLIAFGASLWPSGDWSSLR